MESKEYYMQALANALRPQVKSVDSEYTNGNGQPWSMKYKGLSVGDNGIQAGSYGSPNDPNYFADIYARLGDRKVIPDFDKMINTPLGNLELSSNEEDYNSLRSDFYPNDRTQGYIQALANLLRGR
jgi:hypothetical protein